MSVPSKNAPFPWTKSAWSLVSWHFRYNLVQPMYINLKQRYLFWDKTSHHRHHRQNISKGTHNLSTGQSDQRNISYLSLVPWKLCMCTVLYAIKITCSSCNGSEKLVELLCCANLALSIHKIVNKYTVTILDKWDLTTVQLFLCTVAKEIIMKSTYSDVLSCIEIAHNDREQLSWVWSCLGFLEFLPHGFDESGHALTPPLPLKLLQDHWQRGGRGPCAAAAW